LVKLILIRSGIYAVAFTVIISMKKICLLVAIAGMQSCNSNKNGAPALPVASPSKDTAIIKAKYTASIVNNKKDFYCGMPVSYGIEDTCHYKGKVYGFCSAGCKEEFLKSPAKYLSKK